MSTDHAAKARQHLCGWDTEGDWKAEVAAAQVHATLALVEQQRLTNLIAIATRNDDALSRGLYRVAAGSSASLEDQLARGDAWFAEIREGLGLA